MRTKFAMAIAKRMRSMITNGNEEKSLNNKNAFINTKKTKTKNIFAEHKMQHDIE